MEKKQNNTLTFYQEQPQKTTSLNAHSNGQLKGIVRHYYRVPLDSDDSLYARINNIDYKLTNISTHGFQFIANTEKGFQVREMIDLIELKIEDSTLQLKGKLVYIERIDFDTYAFGIKIESFYNDPDATILKSYINRKLEHLFYN